MGVVSGCFERDEEETIRPGTAIQNGGAWQRTSVIRLDEPARMTQIAPRRMRDDRQRR